MEKSRFEECMVIGKNRCLSKQKSVLSYIDPNTLKLASVKLASQWVEAGLYTKEEALTFLVNLLGNQIIALYEDVLFHEECEKLNDIEESDSPIFQILVFPKRE